MKFKNISNSVTLREIKYSFGEYFPLSPIRKTFTSIKIYIRTHVSNNNTFKYFS